MLVACKRVAHLLRVRAQSGWNKSIPLDSRGSNLQQSGGKIIFLQNTFQSVHIRIHCKFIKTIYQTFPVVSPQPAASSHTERCWMASTSFIHISNVSAPRGQIRRLKQYSHPFLGFFFKVQRIKPPPLTSLFKFMTSDWRGVTRVVCLQYFLIVSSLWCVINGFLSYLPCAREMCWHISHDPLPLPPSTHTWRNPLSLFTLLKTVTCGKTKGNVRIRGWKKKKRLVSLRRSSWGDNCRRWRAELYRGAA